MGGKPPEGRTRHKSQLPLPSLIPSPAVPSKDRPGWRILCGEVEERERGAQRGGETKGRRKRNRGPWGVGRSGGGGWRKGEGEACGARERFCSPVSCFPLAGPPVQELDPHPHPGGSRKGRARLPPALSQEGLGQSGKGPRSGVAGLLASPSARPPPPSLENRGFWVRIIPALVMPSKDQGLRPAGSTTENVLSHVRLCRPKGRAMTKGMS